MRTELQTNKVVIEPATDLFGPNIMDEEVEEMVMKYVISVARFEQTGTA